jgi:hypothetical protein
MGMADADYKILKQSSPSDFSDNKKYLFYSFTISRREEVIRTYSSFYR